MTTAPTPDRPSPLGRPPERRGRPPRGAGLDPRTRDTIARLKGKLDARSVADLARVSLRTVYRVWGGGPRLHQLTDEERAAVVARHAAGEGTRALAGEYGVTQRTVQGVVKRARDAAGRG